MSLGAIQIITAGRRALKLCTVTVCQELHLKKRHLTALPLKALRNVCKRFLSKTVFATADKIEKKKTKQKNPISARN